MQGCIKSTNGFGDVYNCTILWPDCLLLCGSYCIKEVIIIFLPEAWLVCILDMFVESLFLMVAVLSSSVKLWALHIILHKNLHSVLISKRLQKKKKRNKKEAFYEFSLNPFCYETRFVGFFPLLLFFFWLWNL